MLNADHDEQHQISIQDSMDDIIISEDTIRANCFIVKYD